MIKLMVIALLALVPYGRSRVILVDKQRIEEE
jgi:hypothetical protein